MSTTTSVKTEKPHSKSNPLRQIREARLIGKTELARKAGVSRLTIDRIENGFACRSDTKRKILQALGLEESEMPRVFPPPNH